MNINWDVPFTYEGVLFPTYGNYGGADYSAGVIGGTPEFKDHGNPYLSFNKLQTVSDAPGENNDSVDPLDYLFYRHDVAITLADDDPADVTAANLTLLKGLVKLDPAKFDPEGEASLYAGFATLAMLGQLAEDGQLGLLSPKLIFAALEDAIRDIQYGFEHLPESELQPALAAYFEYDPLSETFAFNFDVHTSAGQELLEFAAINLVNNVLDAGEGADAAPINTFLTDAYTLTFHLDTRDLDLA